MIYNVITKTNNPVVLSIEELIIAQAWLGLMADRIHENGHDVPKGIKDDERAIGLELTERLRADKERQLGVLKLRKEGLLSVNEKRKSVEDEIEKLETELGLRKSPVRTKRS